MKLIALLLSLAFSTLAWAQSNISKNACMTGKQLLSPGAYLPDTRSDSVDISNYEVTIDLTDYVGQIISGTTLITATPKVDGVTALKLDLMHMTITHLTVNGANVGYQYNDTTISIDLGASYNTGINMSISVSYTGNPVQDPTGWGGMYYTSGYIWNLGVAFGDDPHNYGRPWHACFDNFVERATYTTHIKTAGARIGKGNGELIGTQYLGGDTVISSWRIDEEIPTYLACVAAANYKTVHDSYDGINGSIPIELYAMTNDTNNLKASFANLKGAMEAFEEAYGPYRWNKVGYSIVPFNGGAMEHATNIAYPLSSIDGTLSDETLMAHELSHHWWGNLATCRTQEDMWINEGWAKYSEMIFTEHMYGWDAYRDMVADNHYNIIRYAHVTEEIFRAVSGVPHEYTYGTHVYNQGADVAHTLRGYMGDDLFFSSIKTFLNDNQFTDVNSYDFRDALTAASGLDMSPFFDGWVFNPGFPNFGIDSVETIPNGSTYDATVHIKQRLDHAPNLYSAVPMEITFYDSNWDTHTTTLNISGETSIHQINLPFEPVHQILNKEHRISQAVTSDEIKVNSTATHYLTKGMLQLRVTDFTDSSLLHVEHHWAAPDEIKTHGVKYELSDYRFWKISGIQDGMLDLEATFTLDGSEANGYLDSCFNGVHEDSLHLMYRSGPEADWEVYPYYTQNHVGQDDNDYCWFVVDSLLLGEYTYGRDKYDATTLVNQIEKQELIVYPNPSKGLFNIELSEPFDVEVFDQLGKLVYKKESVNRTVDLSHVPNGIYIYKIATHESSYSGNFVKN